MTDHSVHAPCPPDPFDLCVMIVEEECWLDMPKSAFHRPIGRSIRDRIRCAQRDRQPVTSGLRLSIWERSARIADRSALLHRQCMHAESITDKTIRLIRIEEAEWLAKTIRLAEMQDPIEPSPDERRLSCFLEAGFTQLAIHGVSSQAEVHTASSRYQEGFTTGYRKAQEDLGVETGDRAASYKVTEIENYRLALAWISKQSNDPKSRELASEALEAFEDSSDTSTEL